jgi:Mg2+-importing ATPase
LITGKKMLLAIRGSSAPYATRNTTVRSSVCAGILGEYTNSLIILAVLLVTGLLGFLQERNAGKVVQALRALVHSKATAVRDGKPQPVTLDEVVTGDVVLLKAGDLIPADALIIHANDLHVNESVLTGESFPEEKFAAASFFTGSNTR